MKKTIFSGLAMAAIALNPLIVSAATDSKYPAADFEPSVIYMDKDAVTKDQPQNESDPKYPASNFTPVVVFVDNQLADQTQEETDPKYPAAYFKPKVIYPWFAVGCNFDRVGKVFIEASTLSPDKWNKKHLKSDYMLCI